MSDARKNVRDYYDKTAADWAKKWYADDSTLPLLRAFMSLLPARPRILDLCCGAGYESMRLHALGVEVMGLDFSEASIAIARGRNPGLTFLVGDMLKHYSGVGPVDAMVCIAGLVHLPAEQLRTAFIRMNAVLKPGGQALFVVRDGVGRQANSSDVIVDGDCYDRAFYAHTLEELVQESAGIFAFDQEIPEQEPSIWRNYAFVKP